MHPHRRRPPHRVRRQRLRGHLDPAQRPPLRGRTGRQRRRHVQLGADRCRAGTRQGDQHAAHARLHRRPGARLSLAHPRQHGHPRAHQDHRLLPLVCQGGHAGRSPVEKQKGKTISRARAGAPVQGFTVIDDVLLITSGAANERTLIDAYSFTTGKLLRTLDITDLGFKLAELEEFKASGVPLPKREAEGMDGWHVGIKVWEGEQRVLRVYRMNRWWQAA